MILRGMIVVAAILVGNVAFGVIGVDKDFKRGDANNDLLVDTTDAVVLQEYLYLGTYSPVCEASCDANDDGWVDNSDIIFILDYVFNGGAAPLDPGPYYCGADPTNDDLTCYVSACE